MIVRLVGVVAVAALVGWAIGAAVTPTVGLIVGIVIGVTALPVTLTRRQDGGDDGPGARDGHDGNDTQTETT